MQGFELSLIREKIVVTDDADDGAEEKEPVIIRSNRIFAKLGNEKIVARAQNMHTTLRLMAKLLTSFYTSGAILGRDPPYDWQEMWNECVSSYEQAYSPDMWGAVYINGAPVFRTQASSFVDIIEKCALLAGDDYDAAMGVTESALKKIGHAKHMSHSQSVAAIFSDADDTMRCGIIHRDGDRDMPFNFIATGGKQKRRITQSINAAAGFLEAINQHFIIRNLRGRIQRGEGDAKEVLADTRQIRAAIARQSAISRAMYAFEATYNVKYRPDKPDFFSDV